MFATVIKNVILISLLVLIAHLTLINYNDNKFSSFILEKSMYYFNEMKAFGQSLTNNERSTDASSPNDKDSVSEANVESTESVAAIADSTAGQAEEEKDLYDFVYDNDENNKDTLETLFKTSLLKPSEESCRECVVECDAAEKSSQQLKNIEEQHSNGDVKTFCVNEVNSFLEKRRKKVKKTTDENSSTKFTSSGQHPVIAEYKEEEETSPLSGFESFSSRYMSI